MFFKFSQRKGITPVKDKIQTESIDGDLRNGLWNIVTIYYWKEADSERHGHLSEDNNIMILLNKIWFNYFKHTLDDLGNYWPTTREKLKDYFYDSKWYEVYDLIEFIANNHPEEHKNESFKKSCNTILKREFSAYRFVSGRITEITSPEEITEIEEAMKPSGPFKYITTHLDSALQKMSDRKNPDYRNSVKESISAVESICKLITGDKKTTLGKALDKIESDGKVKLHKNLREAFKKLYSYTNDDQGIRHALMDDPDLDFEDAKFMLVSCSAFINYLKIKSSKAEIKL